MKYDIKNFSAVEIFLKMQESTKKGSKVSSVTGNMCAENEDRIILSIGMGSSKAIIPKENILFIKSFGN